MKSSLFLCFLVLSAPSALCIGFGGITFESIVHHNIIQDILQHNIIQDILQHNIIQDILQHNIIQDILQHNVIQDVLSQIWEFIQSFLPTLTDITNLPQDTWWGEGTSGLSDETIIPFQVEFSNATISDLRSRINNRRQLHQPLDNSFNTYGTNSNFLADLLDYWAQTYDFEARADELNHFPQFMTNIQGLNIRFIHVKPASMKRVVPLLLIHGSPETAFEYKALIPYLQQDDRDFVFEIVAADIPGYGYSQHTNKKGLGGYQIGIIMKNLMKRLGHEKFYIHTGDIGIFVGQAMAAMYPDDILGYHTNFPMSLMPLTFVKYAIGAIFPSLVGVDSQYADRIYPLTKTLRFLISNTANIHQQATRPDQLGIGLDDSPVAMAAWLLPFFMVGGDGKDANMNLIDGNLYENYDINDLLDSLTIYYDQHCATSVMRFYGEEFDFSETVKLTFLFSKIEVPFAAINFKDEIVYQPDSFLKDKFPNQVQSITLDYGAHYAAMLNPDVLADSIKSAIPKMESFRASA